MAFATQGSGGDDEARLAAVLEQLDPELLPFDRRTKLKSFLSLLQAIRTRRPELVVMEGTGIAGGLALIVARLLWKTKYVVSSGDAIGPFVRAILPVVAPLFALYECLLCRFSAGFIGWTPYLTGRALSFGAPYAMTAPGWAPFTKTQEELARSRAAVRAQLSIPADALVVGIVGSLAWNRRVGYCYGYELVQALKRVQRKDVYAIIVGDGEGKNILESLANEHDLKRVRFTGRVPRTEVAAYLSAMDAASLPQSVDKLGSFRYSTKLSEYLAAGLPVFISQIPASYDLDTGWVMRIKGKYPWGSDFASSLAQTLGTLSADKLSSMGAAAKTAASQFDKATQAKRVAEFILSLS